VYLRWASTRECLLNRNTDDICRGSSLKYKFAQTAFLLILSNISLTPVSFGSLQSSHVVTAGGLISYGQQTYVTVDSTSVTSVNALSLGFQLDGYDIRRFRDRSVLRELARDANFKLVRFFHHRLGDPCSSWNEATQDGTWNWNQIDPLVERIFEIGAEPLICFGYYSPSTGHVSVPRGMATDNDGLPQPETWGNYCVEWLRHFKAKGYPVRFFEIINEPYQLYFWKTPSKLERYVDFWNTVARAMRAENPNIFISADCTTVRHALDYWIDDGDDLDFLGFHKYDSGRTTLSDTELLLRAETYLLTDYGDNEYPSYPINEAREEWQADRGKTLPIVLGESNICWRYNPTDPRIQQMLGAVWAALVIRTGILLDLDYALYWNLAGKSGTGEDFGMINGDNNEPYYTYYALHMIGSNLDVGDQLVEATSSSDDIRALAWIHNEELNVLLICKVDTTQTINLHGLTGQLNLFKIDNNLPFTEAAVQTEVINAKEPLIMNGYTVALLQVSL